MTAFIMACTGLVLFSGLFYLFPRKSEGSGQEDTGAANVDWFRLRRGELREEGREELQQDVELRLLEDDAQGGSVTEASPRQGNFPRWLLLPLIAVISAALYYQLGAAPDVLIGKQLEAISDTSPPEQMEELLRAIEQRAAQRPENLHYAALLGRFYMGQQDYRRAARLYGELATAAPGDSQALAYAAQAEYLAEERVLSARAQLYAEQALAIDPHQRTALGLLGMASFEQQKYRAAIEYWQRLVAMEPEGSESAQMILGVIERARESLAAGGAIGSEQADEFASDIQADEATTIGVTVAVSLPAGATVAPAATVFVLARGANSDSRMPVAVQRLQASQLPTTLRLDDSKSMAGQKLSSMESVVVKVQVSPDGRPGEANASWLGEAGPLQPSLSTMPVEIELKPR